MQKLQRNSERKERRRSRGREEEETGRPRTRREITKKTNCKIRRRKGEPKRIKSKEGHLKEDGIMDAMPLFVIFRTCKVGISFPRHGWRGNM